VLGAGRRRGRATITSTSRRRWEAADEHTHGDPRARPHLRHRVAHRFSTTCCAGSGRHTRFGRGSWQSRRSRMLCSRASVSAACLRCPRAGGRLIDGLALPPRGLHEVAQRRITRRRVQRLGVDLLRAPSTSARVGLGLRIRRWQASAHRLRSPQRLVDLMGEARPQSRPWSTRRLKCVAAPAARALVHRRTPVGMSWTVPRISCTLPSGAEQGFDRWCRCCACRRAARLVSMSSGRLAEPMRANASAYALAVVRWTHGSRIRRGSPSRRPCCTPGCGQLRREVIGVPAATWIT